ncbi:MAG: aspartate kinase [Bacteroidales bacterium]|jgi:aspartate kinase|nr:aspartate kinase [Bacteroidales bacterium]MDD4394292.1 aspartate kinase [Bacteroidales bacterium]
MNTFLNNDILVFKFGGASVKDAEGVRNLQRIVEKYKDKNLLVVISAVGKTTNLLERILDAYFFEKEDPFLLYEQLKENHLSIARELMPDNARIVDKLEIVFKQLHEKLQQPHTDNYEYEYDRIVSFGEILSTKLISTYLNLVDVRNYWLDARQMLKTDATYMEAKINWEESDIALTNAIVEITAKKEANLFITQGFIAGTSDGQTTTFGREGSDYSAAIIAYLLDAESVTIWKDVPGLLNADPKFFPDAVKLDAISYEEAIELSYYGATIIHPKTLKPLQNKNIPLYVKPFFSPDEPGSVISSLKQKEFIPSYIFKRNQILITIFPKDFSFITVDNLSEIFSILSKYGVKPNLMQNSALSFSICTDNKSHRIENILDALSRNYLIKYNEQMELVTIRHYTEGIVEKIKGKRKIYAEQRSRATVQIVVKES